MALPLEKRKLEARQILHQEASSAFKLWDESGMKTDY